MFFSIVAPAGTPGRKTESRTQELGVFRRRHNFEDAAYLRDVEDDLRPRLQRGEDYLAAAGLGLLHYLHQDAETARIDVHHAAQIEEDVLSVGQLAEDFVAHIRRDRRHETAFNGHLEDVSVFADIPCHCVVPFKS